MLVLIPGGLIAAGVWFFFFRKPAAMPVNRGLGVGGGGGGSNNSGVTRFVGGTNNAHGGGGGSGGGSGAKTNINLSGLFNSLINGAGTIFSGASNLAQGFNANGTLPTGLYSGGLFGNSALGGTYTSGQSAMDSSFSPFSSQSQNFSLLGNSDPFGVSGYSGFPGTFTSGFSSFDSSFSPSSTQSLDASLLGNSDPFGVSSGSSFDYSSGGSTGDVFAGYDGFNL